MSMVGSEKDIRILFFYNHKDKNLCEKLIEYIHSVKHNLQASITLLYDQQIQAGLDQKKELDRYFEGADIILLLISPSYFSSPLYDEETRRALRKLEEKKARVIPIILHPVVWRNSLIGHLHALPSTDKPISDSSWKQNEALYDVSLGIRAVILQILQERGVEPSDENDDAESNDLPASSTVFNWTESIPPLFYLTLSGNDQGEGVSRLLRLRKIMRVFYERREVFGEESLDEQAIYDAVRQKFDDEYDLQDCQDDLKYLASRANLARLDDMNSVAYSISSFKDLIHKKFYQATSDGIAIETFIEGRMQSSKGRLSKSELRNVGKLLGEIDGYMAKDKLCQDDFEEIADHWESAFKRWEEMKANAGDYFSTLDRNAQYGQYDFEEMFEKYMEHKEYVVQYVQGFADMLLDLSHEINELFSRWSQKKELLIGSIAEGMYRRSSDIEKPPREVFNTQVREQVTRLEIWFKERSQVFYNRAVAEIHRIVNRATSLVLHQRSRARVNNVTILSTLALQLMQETKFEAAQQVFDAAFAHTFPLHLSEQLAGHIQIYKRLDDMSSVWDEPAPARLSFLPAKQRNASPGGRKLDDPMLDDSQNAYKLQTEELKRQADKQRRFESLFAQRVLNLRSFASSPIDRQDRAILEDIIDGCLNHSTYQNENEEGNSVLLLNPDEREYMHLCSSDGSLFLPCYRLELQNLPE
jgi:hypothetical protein